MSRVLSRTHPIYNISSVEVSINGHAQQTNESVQTFVNVNYDYYNIVNMNYRVKVRERYTAGLGVQLLLTRKFRRDNDHAY